MSRPGTAAPAEYDGDSEDDEQRRLRVDHFDGEMVP